MRRNCSDNFIVKRYHHFDLNDSIRTSYRVHRRIIQIQKIPFFLILVYDFYKAYERKKNYVLMYFYNFSLFIQIPECEDDDFHEERQQNRATPSSYDGGSSATPSRRHNRSSNETTTEIENDMTPTTNTGEQSPRQFSVVSLESHNNNNPSFISSPNIIIKSIFQSEKPQTLFRRFPSAAVFLLLRLRRRRFQRRAVAVSRGGAFS